MARILCPGESTMTPTLFAALLLLVLPDAARTQTLCAQGETDHFSCPIGAGNKMLSVCSNIVENGDVNADSWLQYRFGTKNKIELAFPEEKAGSLSRFEGHVFNPREQPVELADLRFSNGNTAYSVDFARTSSDKAGGVAAFEADVSVALGRARPVPIRCRKVDAPRYYERFKDLNYILMRIQAETEAHQGEKP